MGLRNLSRFPFIILDIFLFYKGIDFIRKKERNPSPKSLFLFLSFTCNPLSQSPTTDSDQQPFVVVARVVDRRRPTDCRQSIRSVAPQLVVSPSLSHAPPAAAIVVEIHVQHQLSSPIFPVLTFIRVDP